MKELAVIVYKSGELQATPDIINKRFWNMTERPKYGEFGQRREEKMLLPKVERQMRMSKEKITKKQMRKLQEALKEQEVINQILCKEMKEQEDIKQEVRKLLKETRAIVEMLRKALEGRKVETENTR